jgi:uncharacterized membrane protein YhiD involved in acid resistance
MLALQSVRDALPAVDVHVSVRDLAIDMGLSALLAAVLGWTYVRCGTSLSNRRRFARNFVLLAATTTLIITVVKANLALSLGLVGALSIVRFRSAIKEPEELAYLFLAIAIGLGFGADQREATLVAFAVILALLWGKRVLLPRDVSQNLYLTVTSREPDRLGLAQMVETLERHCSAVDLKRFDEQPDLVEAAFLVDFDGVAGLAESRSELRRLEPGVTISFLDAQSLA